MVPFLIELGKQDADLRKYTKFLEFLKDTNLPEDRRNKLEAYCSECEETM
jgi:AAA+ ATPase superfamily predicted ATPase